MEAVNFTTTCFCILIRIAFDLRANCDYLNLFHQPNENMAFRQMPR